MLDPTPGIGHAGGRERPAAAEIPFDLKHYPTSVSGNLTELRLELERRVRHLLDAGMRGAPPFGGRSAFPNPAVEVRNAAPIVAMHRRRNANSSARTWQSMLRAAVLRNRPQARRTREKRG